MTKKERYIRRKQRIDGDREKRESGKKKTKKKQTPPPPPPPPAPRLAVVEIVNSKLRALCSNLSAFFGTGCSLGQVVKKIEGDS